MKILPNGNIGSQGNCQWWREEDCRSQRSNPWIFLSGARICRKNRFHIIPVQPVSISLRSIPLFHRVCRELLEERLYPLRLNHGAKLKFDIEDGRLHR